MATMAPVYIDGVVKYVTLLEFRKMLNDLDEEKRSRPPVKKVTVNKQEAK